MARALRIEFPGAIYHVTSRGNARQDIVRDDLDRERWVDWLRRHRRCGHLFQGRYRGHLIEEQGYFQKVSRYIHLNPVRANMVARPEQYPWSSYSGYRRANRTLPWVTYDRVLGEFGPKASTRRRRYASFVRAGVQEPPRSPFTEAVEGLLLGSDAFVARIRALVDERPTDPSVPQLGHLQQRPSIEAIVETVAEHFGTDTRH